MQLQIIKNNGISRGIAISLSVIIAIGFLSFFYSYSFSKPIYMASLFVILIAYIFFQGNDYYLTSYHILWSFPIVIVLMNVVFRGGAGSDYVDLLMLLTCALLVLFVVGESCVYETAIKIIELLSLFFAASVIVQVFAPSIYDQILVFFPAGLKNIILTGSGYRGFSPNVGYTAGYIIAGIIAFYSKRVSDRGMTVIDYISLVILGCALLFTEKRGPTLFLILALFVMLFVSSGLTEKIKAARKVLLIIIILVALVLLLIVFSVDIPIISKLIRTIDTIQAGGDASSGRLGMYDFAWQLFKGNPIYGVGWDNYATLYSIILGKSMLQTHNVYLQLLCETGIIGFLAFASLFFVSWGVTKNEYLNSHYSKGQDDAPWKRLLFFALGYQSFFLLYCLTGNPLYDDFFIILYGFSCAIPIAYRKYSEQKKPIFDIS